MPAPTPPPPTAPSKSMSSVRPRPSARPSNGHATADSKTTIKSAAGARTTARASGSAAVPTPASNAGPRAGLHASKPSLSGTSATKSVTIRARETVSSPVTTTASLPEVSKEPSQASSFDPDVVGYTVLNAHLRESVDSAEPDTRAIVWLDIDNTLYKKSTRIAQLMGERIQAYFRVLGFEQEEAQRLHKTYYSQYGLAIRGLVRHHEIDALEYDRHCDQSLPLEDILRPDPATSSLLADLDRTKCRVLALTNAYEPHALRVLKLLDLDQYIEALIFCDYARPDFACKPEEEYYRAAMIRAGVTEANTHYFVDDSALNIKAAKALGWSSCVLFSEPDDDLEKAAQSAATEQRPTNGHSRTSQVAGQAVGSGADLPVTVLNPLALSARQGDFDEDAIRKTFQALPSQLRIRLLHIILDSCLPGDLASMARVLERHLRLTRDLVSGLPEAVNMRIFEKLDIRTLLRCRTVSKKWFNTTRDPQLWRSHAIELTESDPVPVTPPDDESGWEDLAKGLFFRERNWAKGLPQKIEFFEGHSNMVTSLKLRGRNTLVTGSYDETIRVWDLGSGACKKILGAKEGAKAVACLDLLDEEGILCAGLYDTGRVMVWDMRSWELLQTLSGHNRGIRNVAISKRYLCSVGQDKAIVLWDWRTGNKIVRFGQQSNVSLGVSIVDDNKIVAVTVDGIIRTFGIEEKRMLGEFSIAKLAGDRELAKQLLGSSANMEWFAAHGNSMTVASKDIVVHLEWREHIVPVVEQRLTAEALNRSASRASVSSTPSRVRKTSTTSSIGGQRPVPSETTPSVRPRRDSTASNASNATVLSARGALMRNTARTPSTPASRTSKAPLVSHSRNGSMVAASESRRHSMTPLDSITRPPAAGPRSPLLASGGSRRSLTSSVSSGATSPSLSSFPSMTTSLSSSSTSSTAPSQTPTTASLPAGTRTRLAPNLSVAPRVVSILRTPDMATGCTYPARRRIISATRFSSRAGADRRLYSSTFTTATRADATTPSLSTSKEEDGKVSTNGRKEGSSDSIAAEHGAPDAAGASESAVPVSAAPPSVVPIRGVWQAHAATLQQASRNPMALELDHESCVVGCTDGTVYRLSFVGNTYGENDDAATTGPVSADKGPGDAIIDDLTQLRDIWKELMLPDDAGSNHPGRMKPDLVKKLGLK